MYIIRVLVVRTGLPALIHTIATRTFDNILLIYFNFPILIFKHIIFNCVPHLQLLVGRIIHYAVFEGKGRLTAFYDEAGAREEADHE